MSWYYIVEKGKDQSYGVDKELYGEDRCTDPMEPLKHPLPMLGDSCTFVPGDKLVTKHGIQHLPAGDRFWNIIGYTEHYPGIRLCWLRQLGKES